MSFIKESQIMHRYDPLKEAEHNSPLPLSVGIVTVTSFRRIQYGEDEKKG